MAKIKENEKQLRALDTINDNLNTLQVVNALLASDNPTFTVQGEKKSQKLIFERSAKEGKRVIKILQAYKKQLSKEIEAAAKRCNIILEEEDLALMLEEDEKEEELTTEALSSQPEREVGYGI